MKKNRKDLSILSIATMTTLTSVMALTMSTTVFAKTDAILTKDKTTGQYFQYDLVELNNDSVNKVMEIPAPLYDEYMGKVVQSFHDDKKGYIDSVEVNNAAVDAVMSGTTFNLDTYTESATGSVVITPNGSIQSRVLANGSVVNGTVINTPVVEQPITDKTDIISEFTDANFKEAVYTLIGKTSPSPILYSDVKNITFLDVNSKNISSLSGIECFTSLTYLDCYNNKLATLDVTKNSALKMLDCGANQLPTLDVSKNIALTSLYCYSNQLITLDISKNTALTSLICYNNQLITLDVSKNILLTGLGCYNNRLSTLDISTNTALTYLACKNNQLTTLDVSKNTLLNSLSCDYNQLTTLDVSKNTSLTGLGCDNNKLASLDVNKNILLTNLGCSYNKLTSLDITKNTKLIILNCNNNNLTTLDLSKNTALFILNCSSNQLTTLYSIKDTWNTSIYKTQYTDLTHTTTTNNLVITVVKTFVSNGLITVTDNFKTSDTISTNGVGSFSYRLYGQTQDKTNPIAVNDARMSYTVTNTGNDDVIIDLGVFNAVNPNITVRLMDTNSTTVLIKPGQAKTIAGNVNSAVPTLLITGKPGAAVFVTATAQVFNRDIYGTGVLTTLYTTTSTATAVYTEVPSVQTSIVAGTFIGTLDDAVSSTGDIKLNIEGNRYIQFNVAGVGAGQASAGSVTTTSKDFTINDFNQATILTDDVVIKDPVTGLVVGKTASQKLAAVLGKGAAVQVIFGVGSTNASPIIGLIKVLYTSDMYVSDRTIIK